MKPMKEFILRIFKEMERKTSWGRNELKEIIRDSVGQATDGNSKTQCMKEFTQKLTNTVEVKTSWGRNDLREKIFMLSLDYLKQ
jgi:hypothetical protein